MRIGGTYTYVMGTTTCGVDADSSTFLCFVVDEMITSGVMGIYTGLWVIATALPQHHHQSLSSSSPLTHHVNHRITIHHPSRSYLYPRTFGNGVLALHALSSSLQYCLP
jgi:hypothetical protein